MEDCDDSIACDALRLDCEVCYRAVFEAVPEPVLLVNGQGWIVDANPAAAHLYHRPREAMRGQIVGSLFVDPSVLEGLFENRRGQLPAGIHLRQDGTRFFAEVSVSYIQQRGGSLAILLVVGAAASNFLGKKLVSWWDALLNRIPVVRSIYSSVKQVSDTLFSDGGNAFRTAVLVQWPRESVWTIAFITGTPIGEVAAHLKKGGADEYVSVYVPTTPNPTGGYFVLLKMSDCIELEMSVDEALKYIVSMGVVVPGGPASLPAKSI